MNRIELSIKTSKDKNLIYNIYRSTRPEDLPASLEVLQYLTPAIIVDESKSTPVIINTSEKITLDVSHIPTGNLVRHILKYEPVNSDTTKVIISINFNNPDLLIKYESIKLEFFLNTSGVITEVVKTNRDKTIEIITTGIEDMVVMSNNYISLNKELIDGNYNITCAYGVEIIEVVDIEAAGIKEPTVDVEYKNYNISKNVSVPYLTILPRASEDGIVYYYRVVGIDPLGDVSYPSPLMSSVLSQKKTLMTYQLQESKNYHDKKELADWSDSISVNPGIGIMIGRPLKTVYTFPGQTGFQIPDSLAVNEIVPAIPKEEIKVNTVYIKSDNTLVLTMPNVWVCDKNIYHSRPRNAYRVKASIFTEKSEYSDIVFDKNNAEINIEKMIVIKRNCTSDTDPLLPSTVNQDKTSVIKTFIRKHGLYYTDLEHDQCPYNIPFAYTDVIVMSRLSVFNEITISDNACVPGQAYNYTVYLYDSFGNTSEPTTITVQT